MSIISASSPTPSMQDEMDEEDRQNLEMSQEELMQTLTEGDDLVLHPFLKEEQAIPRVGITVESFYPAEKAKNFVADVLSMAGINNPLTIDFEFQRYVILNDHCYTNLIMPNKTKLVSTEKLHVNSKLEFANVNMSAKTSTELELSPRCQRVRKPSIRFLESNETENSKEGEEVAAKKETASKIEEEQLENSESEYESEDSETSIEDNDNDSDLDFDINRTNRSLKKSRKKRKILKSKTILRKSGNTINKKRQSTRSFDSDDLGTNKERTVIKYERLSQRKLVSKGKQPPAVPKQVGILSSTINITPGKSVQSEVILETPTNQIHVPCTSYVQQKHSTRLLKKEKRKETHMDLLFSDMSSLFSNPDKIKKIDTKGSEQVPQMSKSLKDGDVSVHLNDFIDSIVENELEHPALIVESQMVERLPSMVKNVEHPESDLQDNALLETLGGSLPEDFLHTVAELAENKEIQEIIDKQVLGVHIGQQIAATTVTNQPISSKPIKLIKNEKISISDARKHPLKIMRNDGRVVTLPPIEMPTTRGAKKRLKTEKFRANFITSKDIFSVEKNEQIVDRYSGAVTEENFKKSLQKELPFQSREKSTSRRSSINHGSIEDGHPESTSGSKRKRAITNPAVLAVLNNNQKADDSESGDSWNSEDDPDR